MADKKINTALISVFHKDGLEDIIRKLDDLGVKIITTGGTYDFISDLGVNAEKVEDLTGYPSILDGRVKTLHPKVFGGILARRNQEHLDQLKQYDIPEIDLVVVDLYPFEQTVASTSEESKIIEKIDIGGISLIRAAAKNYNDVVVIPSQKEYFDLETILHSGNGSSTLEQRKRLATKAFAVSSHYDTAIYTYFDDLDEEPVFRASFQDSVPLRYGENPHQNGVFYGDLKKIFTQQSGKALSYNNLVDIDAAIQLMSEFVDAPPAMAILKHTNACGVAIRDTISEAWDAALAADNVSAFGGIFISNTSIDMETAVKIDQLFYEVLLAPGFDAEVIDFLKKKKNRILLEVHSYYRGDKTYKSLLNGVIVQDMDTKKEDPNDLTIVTERTPEVHEIDDLLFANVCVKHLKSNAIVLAKGTQLLGMGSGQTSRVDALKQAILKAKDFGFDLEGSVMASDAFFPFPDCVEIAHNAGITAVIQPGGSVKDQESIDYCNDHDMAMVTTGNRHFKH